MLTHKAKEAKMPDITMCDNKFCPIKCVCYRYRATPDRRQSFSTFKPKLTPRDQFDRGLEWDCDDFWDSRDYAETKLCSTEEADKRNSKLFRNNS